MGWLVCTGQRAVGNHELRNGFGGRAIAGVELQGGIVHEITKQLWSGATRSWEGMGRSTAKGSRVQLSLLPVRILMNCYGWR